MPRPTHPYLPMAHGFMYLVAIVDVGSRKVLSHRVSNTLTTDFCVAALEEAIARYGAPEIVSDYLEGGKDDDTLYGGSQSSASEDLVRDMLVWGAGNDTYYAGSTDIIIDTAGNDTTPSTSPITGSRSNWTAPTRRPGIRAARTCVGNLGQPSKRSKRCGSGAPIKFVQNRNRWMSRMIRCNSSIPVGAGFRIRC